MLDRILHIKPSIYWIEGGVPCRARGLLRYHGWRWWGYACFAWLCRAIHANWNSRKRACRPGRSSQSLVAISTRSLVPGRRMIVRENLASPSNPPELRIPVPVSPNPRQTIPDGKNHARPGLRIMVTVEAGRFRYPVYRRSHPPSLLSPGSSSRCFPGLQLPGYRRSRVCRCSGLAPSPPAAPG